LASLITAASLRQFNVSMSGQRELKDRAPHRARIERRLRRAPALPKAIPIIPPPTPKRSFAARSPTAAEDGMAGFRRHAREAAPPQSDGGAAIILRHPSAEPYNPSLMGKPRSQCRGAVVVTRETHFLWGRRYLLTIRYENAKPTLVLDHRRVTLTVRPGASAATRAEVVHDWHKSLLHDVTPRLIRKWEPKLGVKVRGYFLQRMKTKWGSCNHRARAHSPQHGAREKAERPTGVCDRP
jgi:hypothetical protein